MKNWEDRRLQAAFTPNPIFDCTRCHSEVVGGAVCLSFYAVEGFGMLRKGQQC